MRLSVLFILTSFFSFSQTQIGNDIDGFLAGDQAGSVSVSADGSIVAIGGTGNDTGHARVFENSSGDWVQIGNPILGEATGDHFGRSVSLSSDGSIIAIGGPNNASEDTDAGHVRVFENISGVWTQIGDDINGDIVGNRMGLFVSLSDDGTILAISGYECCGLQHGTPFVGKTRIYENISGEWTLIGGEITTGFAGVSDVELSADGSVVAIASPGGGATLSSGFYVAGVKVYKNISGTWTQIGDPIVGGVWSPEFFGGVSLTNDGSKMAVGSRNTRVYENIEDEWVQLGEDIETGNLRPRISISSNANTIAIGGSITRLYENSTGSWVQLGVDIIEEAPDDAFGSSIELSGDGRTLVVGAPRNDGNGTDAGHARVYDLSALLSTDEFILTQFSLYPNPAQDQFTIELSNGIELQSLNIYSNLGQFIQYSQEQTIVTSNLASGLYYVQVITNKGKATKKLIIK